MQPLSFRLNHFFNWQIQLLFLFYLFNFFNQINSLNSLLVSIFVPLRHLCASVPEALWSALPLLLKNSREYFPESAKCLGIQPSSSMMWAMWSTEERGMRNEGRKGEGGIRCQKKRRGREQIGGRIKMERNEGQYWIQQRLNEMKQQ